MNEITMNEITNATETKPVAFSPAKDLTFAIVSNRNERTPITINEKTANENMLAIMKRYRDAVVMVESAASTVIKVSIKRHAPEAVQSYTNALQKQLDNLFDVLDIADATENDVRAVLAIVGDIRTDKETKQKIFIPAGKMSFRKKLEVLIALREDEVARNCVADYDEREAARKARNKARREKKKAEAKSNAN